jgi:hypothetical protein
VRRALWLVLFPIVTHASEAELWTGAGVEVDIAERVEVQATQHLRLGMSPFGTGEALTDLGLGFQPSEYLKLGAAYRFGVVDIGDKAELRHRLAFDATLPFKADALRISLRERYQVRIGTAYNTARHTLRTRLKLKLKTESPVHPYASLEPHVELGGSGAQLTKWRTTAGTAIELDRTTLDLFYRLDAPTPAANESVTHIVGVHVSWK